MKYRVTILCFFICTNLLLSQEWAPVHLADKFNFQHDTSDYITNTLWVDSVEVNGIDSVF